MARSIRYHVMVLTRREIEGNRQSSICNRQWFVGLDTRGQGWPYQPSITLISLTAFFS
jgi:hypothetical protein